MEEKLNLVERALMSGGVQEVSGKQGRYSRGLAYSREPTYRDS